MGSRTSTNYTSAPPGRPGCPGNRQYHTVGRGSDSSTRPKHKASWRPNGPMGTCSCATAGRIATCNMRGPFGGVTPGVTAPGAPTPAALRRSPRGHMQPPCLPGLHLRQCNAALRPSNLGSDASWRAPDGGAIPAVIQAFHRRVLGSIRQTPLARRRGTGFPHAGTVKRAPSPAAGSGGARGFKPRGPPGISSAGARHSTLREI